MKALIVAGGCPPGAELLHQCVRQADLLVAADRGVEVCLEEELIPDILIGDLDSAPPAVLTEARMRIGEILKAPCEKNETDLELAAAVCVQRGADDICILGASGGRTDHLLGNLHVLLHLHFSGIKAKLEDENEIIRIIDGTARFTGIPGQTLSLIPAGKAARVSAQGLYYPLDELLLTWDDARGISNRITDENVCITTTGPLYLIRRKAALSENT